METDVIVQCFKSSIAQHSLIYETLIADGDSSVFNSLDQLGIYEEQGIVIKKVECVNHLLCNMTKNLKKLAQGSLGPKPLRDVVLLRLMRFRAGVTKAAEYRNKEARSDEEKVFRLREDVKNIPRHILGDHSKCASYFCDKKNTQKVAKEEIDLVPEFEKCSLLSAISEIMQRLEYNSESLLKNLKKQHCRKF